MNWILKDELWQKGEKAGHLPQEEQGKNKFEGADVQERIKKESS